MASTPRPVIIAIDGRSGAGKTTVAVELAALLRRHRAVSLFHLEDIYPGWDGLAGGVQRYIDSVLRPLHQGLPATWTAWDWESKNDGAPRTTAVAPVVLVEGVGSSHGKAAEFLDAIIWVDAPGLVRKQRALARDGDIYAPFWDIWAEQEERLLEQDAGESASAAVADIIIDGTHGVADAPPVVLQALSTLPAMEHVLGPELARRRGLDFSVVCLDGLPPAAILFDVLYGNAQNAVWLDSSDSATDKQAASRSRFSVMADDSGCFGQLARHEHGVTTVLASQVTTRIGGPFFQWLDSVWGRKAVRAPSHYPGDFTLGWLGYLGYDLKAETGGCASPTPRSATPSDDMPSDDTAPGVTVPAAALLFAGRAVVLDHLQDCLYVLTLTSPHQPGSTQESADFCARVRTALAAARAAAPNEPGQSASSVCGAAPQFTIRDGELRYKSMIAAAKAEIHDGNSYEICLTTQLEARLPLRMAPLSTYAALRKRNPTPFSAFLRLGTMSVCSTSPERFLRIDSEGLMRAEPIKGTRRRDADPELDAALKEDLGVSEKDRAENIMIVDLLRNDLSRFAIPQSLTVPRLCQIETYATVHQMVSTIEARLAPGSSRAQAVAAAFPAGSMTGAPKISTMAILDALEAGTRGIYSGAIGYFSLNAATDLSVVIRTLILQDTHDGGTHLSLGIGGAITADSQDEAEWQEIQAKAHGVLSTLGSTFPAHHC
ncbi:aminodeoxychorismate synthase component I [Arthrobacter antibioticus]|uniref:aminodeoxychorismate synthase component I n=1 Tax=Arthrobacter sp. H35-MC1 TaxID=3046203 RepID=UPI0024B8E226|nr:aminodeoxychorismate synthase component I [Arthrobacter sp. H35-MC1]MDJ0318445.1 aminodeoxychorismate synthase component I [Arthrobacter sp. H35-MC1]